MSGADAAPTLGTAPLQHVVGALDGPGVWLDLGLGGVRLRSDVPMLAAQLRAAYAHFPFVVDAAWSDFSVELRHRTGLRRWVRPQVLFHSDGQVAFDPFPADSPLPLFEWGLNWFIGRRINDRLLLHAGVVERDGLALIMPAMPGSGKSTLTAALSLQGWRLLSDEFAALDLQSMVFNPVLKPVALKNESIDVIQRAFPDARMGPRFPNTRKGTVAHVAALPEAVAGVRRSARPGAVVLPRFSAGSATHWQPLEPATVFSALAFNAFNYPVTAAAGFRAVVQLVRDCPAWQLVYSDLDDALATIDRAWSSTVLPRRLSEDDVVNPAA